MRPRPADVLDPGLKSRVCGLKNLINGSQDEWEVLIHNGTDKTLVDVWITSGLDWIHVAPTIGPGEVYSILVPCATRRIQGGIKEYRNGDYTLITCRWRPQFGWHSRTSLQVNNFLDHKGHRLTQSERDAFDI